MAALWLTGTTVPVFAAFMSVLLYLTLFSWSPFIATVGGSLLVLLCWFLLARLYQCFTGADRANAASYEQLLNRLQQTVAWYEILQQKTPPPKNSLYAIAMQEIQTSIKAICKSLQTPGLSWISATGYVSVWKLMHRIDEAFIEIEPIEAVIHNALHDEMSLEDSMLPNKDDLLNKLRRAVVMLDQGASIYLNQQPPQAIRPTIANVVNPKENEQALTHNGAQHEPFSNTIDPITQARTIIYEVRTTLHHFRDDRWDKLIRVRNQLMKMTLVTALLLFALVEFAIMMKVGVEMIKAATIFFFVGSLVGLFSRLYNQSQTDTSIDDFRLATARLIAAPIFCGLAAIGGVLVVQKDLVLSAPNLLMAAAFGLTPSLFTNAIQKQADQYKTDLKSTAASSGEKQEKQKKS